MYKKKGTIFQKKKWLFISSGVTTYLQKIHYIYKDMHVYFQQHPRNLLSWVLQPQVSWIILKATKEKTVGDSFNPEAISS